MTGFLHNYTSAFKSLALLWANKMEGASDNKVLLQLSFRENIFNTALMKKAEWRNQLLTLARKKNCP